MLCPIQFTGVFSTIGHVGSQTTLPNTQKQTQGGCQIKEAKKYGPNERTEQSPMRTKQNADSQPTRCRVQTLVIRMLRGMIVYSQKIKEEVKVLQSEIKNRYTGNQR